MLHKNKIEGVNLINKEKVEYKYTKVKKNEYLSNKPISCISDDYIGIYSYISAIKSSIKNDDKIIALSSKYGEGKSSIVNVLSNDKELNKVSIISLYDLKNINSNSNGKNIGLNEFSKTFLYRLASDFKGLKYAKYISKVFNERISRISICVNKTLYFILFILSIIIYILGFSFLSEPSVLDFLSKEHILFKYKNLIAYSLFLSSTILLSFVLAKSRILFTYWNSNANIPINNEEIVTLYAELINDSFTCSTRKHSLVVIEDVDRCIENKSDIETVKAYLRLLKSLAHYECHSRLLSKKIDKVHFLVCLDEERLIHDNNYILENEVSSVKDSKNENLIVKNNLEELNKLFDYRIHLGSVYKNSYDDLFNKLVDNIGLTDYKEELYILLYSENNNLRFIKNELNDIKLKFNTIMSRFDKIESKTIIKSCIAYSYLKNNFFIDFNNHIEEEIDNVIKIKKCLKCKITNEVISDYKLGDNYIDSLLYFIANDYLNKDYQMFLYNKSKYDKFTNDDQECYFNYICNKQNITTEKFEEHLNNIDSEIICKYDNDEYSLLVPYPLNIINYNKITNLIIKKDKVNVKLANSLIAYIDLRKVDSLETILKFLELIKDCNKNVIVNYISKVYTNNFNQNLILTVQTNDLFYQFRKKLISLIDNDIYKFANWFKNSLESIHTEELNYLDKIDDISKLINIEIKTNNLEEVLCLIKEHLNVVDLENYATIWSDNIINYKLYLNFTCYTLKNMSVYSYKLLKSLEKYRDVLNAYDFEFDLNKQIDNSYYSNYQSKDNFIFWNLLSEASLNSLFNNRNYKTYITKLLKEHKFKELINYDFKSQFQDLLNSNLDYVKEELLLFKKYLLADNSDIYNFLFEGEYEFLLNIDYDLNKITNPYIVIMKLKNKDLLVSYLLFNKETFNDDYYALEYIISYYNNYIESLNDTGFLKLLLGEFKNYIIYDFKKNKLIYRLIQNLNDEINKPNIVIEYQIITKSFLSDYFQLTFKCKDDDLLLRYCNFINEYDVNDINLTAIYYCPKVFKYNDLIIDRLFNNGYYGVTLLCGNNDKYKKMCINNLNYNDLRYIYHVKHLFIFAETNVLNRIRMTGNIIYFNDEEINNIIVSNINYTKPMGVFLDILSDSQFKAFVSNYKANDMRLFVDILKHSSKAENIFSSDKNYKDEVYSKLSNAKAKCSFTRKFGK